MKNRNVVKHIFKTTKPLAVLVLGLVAASGAHAGDVPGNVGAAGLLDSSVSTKPTTGNFSGITGSAGVSEPAGIEAFKSNPDVLVKIGDLEIKKDEVLAALEQYTPAQRAEFAKDPEAFDQFLRTFALQRLVYKEAVAKEWDKKKEVAEQLEVIRVNAISDSYLLSVIKAPDDFPGEEELHTVYEANKAKLVSPKQYRLAQILIEVPVEADPQTLEKRQKKLDAVHEKLKTPDSNFNAIARAESDDKASAAHGGDLGWLPESKVPPVIRAQLASLNKNGITEPIRLDDGWRIVKIVDIEEPHPLTFEEARDVLKEELRSARVQASRLSYLKNLLKQNTVTVNSQAAGDVLPKAAKK